MTDTEKLNQLIDIVIDVRDLQKTYFQSRDRRILRDAQRKEAELDKWLAQNGPVASSKQTKMF